MERLNIPLRRTRKTTRHTRRVVWLLAALLIVVFLLVVWVVSSIWFTRDSMQAIRPTDTALTIRLLPTDKNKQLIKKFLNHTPLIQKRGLTIDDILPATHGELALFLQSDGSHIVGLRGKREMLPTSLLDAHGIVVQEPEPGLFLLSDTIVATAENTSDKHLNPPFRGINETYLGTITTHDGDQNMAGYLAASNDGFTVRFPKQPINPITAIDINQTDYAGLSTTALTNKELLRHVSEPIGVVLRGLQGIEADQMVKSALNSSEGEVFLGKRDGDNTFLLALPSQEFTSALISDTLRTVASLRAPETQSVVLPDQTTMEEIVIDPESINIEPDTIAGVRFIKSPRTKTQPPLWAGEHEALMVFSNDQELIERWVHARERRSENKNNKKQFYIRPHVLLSVINQHLASYSTIPLFSTLNTKMFITMENGWFFTNIKAKLDNVDNL